MKPPNINLPSSFASHISFPSSRISLSAHLNLITESIRNLLSNDESHFSEPFLHHHLFDLALLRGQTCSTFLDLQLILRFKYEGQGHLLGLSSSPCYIAWRQYSFIGSFLSILQCPNLIRVKSSSPLKVDNSIGVFKCSAELEMIIGIHVVIMPIMQSSARTTLKSFLIRHHHASKFRTALAHPSDSDLGANGFKRNYFLALTLPTLLSLLMSSNSSTSPLSFTNFEHGDNDHDDSNANICDSSKPSDLYTMGGGRSDHPCSPPQKRGPFMP
ncbi:hypothetical protein Cgig2_006324 [Carnegiea gigantea]|uniref:Uncharacterized protein n=1 Tax=Carnegiea gigantea TaxID=171969 RepID=A0A9Q1JSQ6_9CARY|nr:hypothetical protein Cgig2_006324 [Carnegiea gigantea]